jgi:hypothetical protein
VRTRFQPQTSLNQLEDVLQEEWYKIPLQTVQNLYEIISRSVAALKAKVVQHHINKEMCTVSVVFPLFCSTPVLSILVSQEYISLYIHSPVSVHGIVLNQLSRGTTLPLPVLKVTILTLN